MRTASAVEVARHQLGARQAARAGSARTGRWPGGGRARASISASSSGRAGDQVVVDRVHHLGGDPDAVRLAGERVERGRHAALERVLDRHHGAVGAPVLHRHHGLVDGRARHGLDLPCGGGEQGLLGVGPGGAEEGDGERPPLTSAERGVRAPRAPRGRARARTRPPRSASRTRGRSRGAGSRTSPRRSGGSPAARSSWTGGPTSRCRRRSGPASGRSTQPSMRASAARHARLDAGGGVLHPVAQLHEALLQPGGVLDQVELARLARARPSATARSFRTRNASTIARISATPATPAAARATIPSVESARRRCDGRRC